jgi:hypothetical protein
MVHGTHLNTIQGLPVYDLRVCSVDATSLRGEVVPIPLVTIYIYIGGSDAVPSFGGAAFGGGGEKTGATTSAFGAAWGSTGAVSFGSPSSR